MRRSVARLITSSAVAASRSDNRVTIFATSDPDERRMEEIVNPRPYACRDSRSSGVTYAVLPSRVARSPSLAGTSDIANPSSGTRRRAPSCTTVSSTSSLPPARAHGRSGRRARLVRRAHPLLEGSPLPNAGDDLTVRCQVKRYRPIQPEASREQQDALSGSSARESEDACG